VPLVRPTVTAEPARASTRSNTHDVPVSLASSHSKKAANATASVPSASRTTSVRLSHLIAVYNPSLGSSQIGPEADVQPPVRVGIVQRMGEVEPDRSERRLPARAEPRTGLRLELRAFERVAGVHEHRDRPTLAHGMLVLEARDREG